MSAAASPFAAEAGGVRIAVRLTPKAGRDCIDGVKPTASGARQLCVKVTAVPERGKANAALLRLLAKSWRVPASRLSLLSGETDRNKVLRLTGDASELMAELEAWLEEVQQ